MSELPPIPEGFRLVQQAPALPPIPEGFKLVEPSAMDTAKGLASAAGIGIVKGAIGLAGLPADIGEFGAKGIDAATQYIGGKLGVDPSKLQRPGTSQNLSGLVTGEEPKRQTFTGLELPGSHAIRKKVETLTGDLYEPKTVPEQYFQTVGEFVPAALSGPGGVARKLVTQAVVPGVVSETAGQAPGIKGTDLEPYARVAGGIAGGVGATIAGGSGMRSVMRSQLPEWVTDAHITQAEGLIADAAARGINLTWSEALSQVTARPVLTEGQRMVESTPHTRQRMQDVFGERPQQVDAAVRHELENVAPGGTQAPSTIGHAAGEAAEGALTDVRRTINNATDPLYQAAEGTLLTRAEMAPVVRAPGWREARAAVRNDPQLNRYVAHLPDNSVGFLNEVKKYFDQAAENATHPMTAQRNAQRGAGYTRDAADVRQAAIDASNRAAYPGPGPYEIALNAQQYTRQHFLEPLLQGPLGRVAGKDTTTQKAIEALFPKQALAGSADEVATAVSAISQRNPWAARQLVRAHLEAELHNAFTAAGRGQEAAQFSGARFALNVAGSPNVVTQRFENIHAALSNLPNGHNIAAGFEQLLPVLQATGTRTGKGSLTAFNTRELERMATGGSLQNIVKHVASPGEYLSMADRAIGRWQLGQNLNEFARIITDPGSGNYLRAIARLPHNSPRIMLVLGKMIAASTTNKRSEKPKNSK